MAVHTPTPWVVETPMGDETPWIVEAGKKTYEWRCIAMTTSDDPVNDEDRDPVEPLSVADAMANAEFIVKAANNHAALEDFALWVECWVSNPVGSYSVAALDGLFEMTRDRLAALPSIKDRA